MAKPEKLRRDEEAFAQMMKDYSRLLWTVAGGILSSAPGCTEQDVEECVSDVFIELWNRPEGYDPERGSLKSYLCIMAKSRALNRLRQNRRAVVVPLDEYREMAEAADPAVPDRPPEMDYTELYACVRQLPQPTREIVVRRYFWEEKPREIAKKMKLPDKEVENRLYRGKQALAGMLADREREAK